MRFLIGLLAVVFVLLSCENSKCRGEQSNYTESWNEVIVELVFDNGGKGGYDIVTTKRMININP